MPDAVTKRFGDEVVMKLAQMAMVAGVMGWMLASAPATAEAFDLEIAVGAKGGINMVAGQGIPDDSRMTSDQGNQVYFAKPEYYGHFGVGPKAGLSLELRALDFVGLETGFYYSVDQASGYVDKNDALSGRTVARIHSDQVSRAYHLPVLLKFRVPTSRVSPVFGVGAEFIFQTESELEYREERRAGSMGSLTDQLNARNQIAPSNYILLTLSAGMEIKAGPVRIPVELRMGYNLGFDQAMSQRATYDESTGEITYDGIYQGHVGVFTGVLYEFDLLL
ncbi:hypothetical protein DL240_18695 [Lujinxingia litoralis]|uniref:Outer membrane protein beta-barrel domain-containing protein n=1 Tax=Lujinxingia litoralis TaxID=2211119 RepID=A0A328C1H2_9DELT|nr:hypothetical protein [Lujinxingia litoralis]RAL20139.1 hypothetical protein DL240_18695 [Lujinxingia litoralis]